MKLNEIIIILTHNNVKFTVYDGQTIEIIITKYVFDLKIDRCYNLHFGQDDYNKDELIEISSFTWINDEIQVTNTTLTYDEFVKELDLKDYTSKQTLIQLLTDEGIEVEDEGDIITVTVDDGITYTEYRIRFDEREKLYSISIYKYDYETESILRNEEIVFDQMIDEISRYIS